ncbi:hypothetical protein K2X33_07110 [bacterium]|nr:hypothetical protein [bacterium]
MHRNPVILILYVVLSACASVSDPLSPSPVLEPEATPIVEKPSVAPVSPAVQQLTAKLVELGYEGTALELESPDTIDLWWKVFSQPTAANRAIRTVYTGAKMDYDPTPESLTIGGTRDPKAVLAFIKKKVPVRKNPPQNPQPMPISPE